MVHAIDRETVRDLVESRGAQLVEVLPREQYDWAHLPGAVSLPLKFVTADSAAATLDRSRPVIAYCNDFL
jgi:rhodanese-related sulfurtransferase